VLCACVCVCVHVRIRNCYINFGDRGLRSLPEIHPLFHRVVYLYLVATSPLQHEQILGGGKTHISTWQRCSCHFSVVFVCHEWCRFYYCVNIILEKIH
jgi:hypothetical protein